MNNRIPKKPAEVVTEEQVLFAAMDKRQLRARSIVHSILFTLLLAQFFLLVFISTNLQAGLCAGGSGAGKAGAHFVIGTLSDSVLFAVVIGFTFLTWSMLNRASDRVKACLLGGVHRQVIEARISDSGGESPAQSFWRTWNWFAAVVLAWGVAIGMSVSSYAVIDTRGIAMNGPLGRYLVGWFDVSEVRLRSDIVKPRKGNNSAHLVLSYVVTFRDDSTWETRNSDDAGWDSINQAMEFAQAQVAERKKQD